MSELIIDAPYSGFVGTSFTKAQPWLLVCIRLIDTLVVRDDVSAPLGLHLDIKAFPFATCITRQCLPSILTSRSRQTCPTFTSVPSFVMFTFPPYSIVIFKKL